MALISCPECNNQVSDAAASCPSCGHPMQAQAAPQTEARPDKRELFKTKDANFVLHEIAAVASTKTRNWVYLVIGLPAIAMVIFAWMNQGALIAGAATVAGLFVLGFIHVDQGRIASTGDVTDIEEDMDKVSQRYHEAIKQQLVTYNGRNTFLDMQFSINPERVAEFSQAASFRHIWMYVLGLITAAAAFEMNLMWLYGAAVAFALLGVMSRKAALEVTGVGGAKVQLFTRAGDIKRVIDELTQAIEK